MMHDPKLIAETLVVQNEKLKLELHHRVRNNLAIILAALRAEQADASPETHMHLELVIHKVYRLAAEHTIRCEDEYK